MFLRKIWEATFANRLSRCSFCAFLSQKGIWSLFNFPHADFKTPAVAVVQDKVKGKYMFSLCQKNYLRYLYWEILLLSRKEGLEFSRKVRGRMYFLKTLRKSLVHCVTSPWQIPFPMDNRVLLGLCSFSIGSSLSQGALCSCSKKELLSQVGCESCVHVKIPPLKCLGSEGRVEAVTWW